jgi:conjugative relaxase-like TrwC/TraI family protein
MLTSCKLSGAAATVSAYHAKEENYYFSQAGGVEGLSAAPGAQGHVRVHGELASQLGFTPGAAITEADLTNLLSGRNAAGEQVGREHKVIGIDLTFSAPKSVSVAGLLTLRDPKIIEAHDQAVLETMREIERYAAGTQKYIDEKITPVKTGNMAYVTVRDGFNRNHDPHLHTHVVVANMTAYGDKIMALDGRQIMRHDFNKLGDSLYQNKLAANLKEAGYSLTYGQKGHWRMDVVPLAVEREFSTRRVEIEAAKERGIRDMAAWRATRKEKDPQVEKVGVFADWQARVGQYEAKTVEQNRADGQAAREAWIRDAKFAVEARQELAGERGDTEPARWQAAARRATEQSAAATPHALLTEYLTEVARGEAWNPITYAEAEQRLIGEVRAGRLLMTDDGRYTTWEMVRADREALRERSATVALALRPEAAAFQVAEYAKTNVALGLRGLSEQQAVAAAGILAATRGTVVVQGDAGAGKTTMLKAVNDISVRNGWEVVGLAVQGVAARKLEEESGIRSMTLNSYLARERADAKAKFPDLHVRSPRFVVIDESSMLGSRELSELIRRADPHGDKVVLVGDRNQIQGVGAGRPFDRLVETADQAGQLLNLSENYRQRNKELREAVMLARDGHMRESVDALARIGCVSEIEDVSLRRLAVASQYDKDTLILTGSRESRDEINVLIRGDLVKRGVVDRSSTYTYVLSWADVDGVKQLVRRELAVGDVVTFLENEYRAYDVRNGERGQVLKTAERELTVRLEDGRTVELDLKRYSALDYGYAMTTYKAQGQTYNKVVVEADTSVPQLQNQRNTYVQITRAREDVRIITDDKAEFRELAGVLNFKSDTFGIEATYEKAAAMERRAYAQAYGMRAQREVDVKSLEAGAALRQVEHMAYDSMSAKQRTREIVGSESPEQSHADERNGRIHNEEFLTSSKIVSIASDRKEHMRNVEVSLAARQDITPDEKRAIVEHLAKPESADTLAKFKEPEKIIAAARVEARTADLQTATKGMTEGQKINVTLYVKNREYERDRVNKQGRDLGLERGRGNDFTL